MLQPHALKVRIIKENANRVTLHFISLNRQMPVSREEFEQRVAQGVYQVLN